VPSIRTCRFTRATPASPSRQSATFLSFRHPPILTIEHVARYGVSNRENVQNWSVLTPARDVRVRACASESRVYRRVFERSNICARRFERTSHLPSRCALIVFADVKRKHRITRCILCRFDFGRVPRIISEMTVFRPTARAYSRILLAASWRRLISKRDPLAKEGLKLKAPNHKDSHSLRLLIS